MMNDKQNNTQYYNNMHKLFKKIKKNQRKSKKKTSNVNNNINSNTDDISNNNYYNSNNKVLICDDSSINRYILIKYFEKINVETDEAINGQEAIFMVKSNGTYDLIILDVQMPRMNGFDCAKKLRNNGYKGNIIGLTGNSDINSINKCLMSGMNCVASKPVSKNDIYNYYYKYKSIKNKSI